MCKLLVLGHIPYSPKQKAIRNHILHMIFMIIWPFPQHMLIDVPSRKLAHFSFRTTSRYSSTYQLPHLWNSKKEGVFVEKTFYIGYIYFLYYVSYTVTSVQCVLRNFHLWEQTFFLDIFEVILWNILQLTVRRRQKKYCYITILVLSSTCQYLSTFMNCR